MKLKVIVCFVFFVELSFFSIVYAGEIETVAQQLGWDAGDIDANAYYCKVDEDVLKLFHDNVLKLLKKVSLDEGDMNSAIIQYAINRTASRLSLKYAKENFDWDPPDCSGFLPKFNNMRIIKDDWDVEEGLK